MSADDRGDDIADEPLGYLLKRVADALRAEMSGTVLGSLGLSLAQYICLRTLMRTPAMSNAELARQLDVSPQAMNAVVGELEHRGLVTRPDTPKMGRRRPTTLTRDGLEVLKRSELGVRKAERHVLTKLSHQDQRDFRRLLGVLAGERVHIEQADRRRP